MSYEWAPRHVQRPSEYEDEPMGTKDKFWCRPDGENRDWLFKFSRERDGVVRGEDWAEWVVHHVAELLDVPTATVVPATCEGKVGILSRSIVEAAEGESLVHGNSVLVRHDTGYDGAIKRENPRYTVANVRRALRGEPAPVEFRGPDSFDAFDVWCGYLLLDALVAGRDRHHENWAVIERAGARRLAPSFDHGNALGFQESDDRRRRVLEGAASLERWLDRGRSQHFAGRPHLVSLAHDALSAASPSVSDYWSGRLRSLQQEDVESILASVAGERMSYVARRFALTIIVRNWERLLNGYRSG